MQLRKNAAKKALWTHVLNKPRQAAKKRATPLATFKPPVLRIQRSQGTVIRFLTVFQNLHDGNNGLIKASNWPQQTVSPRSTFSQCDHTLTVRLTEQPRQSGLA